MKNRIMWMGVLFFTVWLLTACRGTNTPTPTQNIGQADQAEPTVVVDSESDIQPTAKLEIEPTTSTPFEQSYDANPVSDRDYSEYEIVTLLPPDGIPALTNPSYYGVSQADREYSLDEIVIGIEFNGDARAYSIGLLSRHEIVNDTVGGIHLAVTW
jgi:hypothetical protein